MCKSSEVFPEDFITHHYTTWCHLVAPTAEQKQLLRKIMPATLKPATRNRMLVPSQSLMRPFVLSPCTGDERRQTSERKKWMLPLRQGCHIAALRYHGAEIYMERGREMKRGEKWERERESSVDMSAVCFSISLPHQPNNRRTACHWTGAAAKSYTRVKDMNVLQWRGKLLSLQPCSRLTFRKNKSCKCTLTPLYKLQILSWSDCLKTAVLLNYIPEIQCMPIVCIYTLDLPILPSFL